MSRCLIVRFMDEEKRIIIDDDTMVTFGPSIPAPKARGDWDAGPRAMEYALRVYRGKTEKGGLIAVFTGVRSFHEESIKVEYDENAL